MGVRGGRRERCREESEGCWRARGRGEGGTVEEEDSGRSRADGLNDGCRIRRERMMSHGKW